MKRDVKTDILKAGAGLVHRQGFNRTGLKEILDAASVPKGSFYFYFKSKEDFGLALIDYYRTRMREASLPLFTDKSLAPLERLKRFFAARREQFEASGCECGCPIGNLAQEMSDLSPDMRQAVCDSFDGFTAVLEGLLREAFEGGAGDDSRAAELASFILDAWEGALMRMKAEKSVEPLRRFEDIVFGRLLR